MDGHNGGYRPRTAGERNNTPGNGDNNVRDWQRNTWFGPAPVNTNPFEEPEDAPELKESRSENVNERRGDFWNTPGQTGQNTSPLQSQQTGTGVHVRIPEKKTERRPRRFRTAVILLLFLIVTFLILRYGVYSVKEIRVIGNKAIPAEEIIRTSGIRQGDSIIMLDENTVRSRIQSDYRLRFTYMARELPGTVILSIREREPCCWISYCGILYVMDKNRMILYESEDPNSKPSELVEIKGLEVRSNTVVGQFVTLGNEAQQSIFKDLFQEMKVLKCTDRIADADISNTSSILLTTRDGFTVSMGDRTNIHAKLRSILAVQDKLKEMGYTSGTINVSNLEEPLYYP